MQLDVSHLCAGGVGLMPGETAGRSGDRSLSYHAHKHLGLAMWNPAQFRCCSMENVKHGE